MPESFQTPPIPTSDIQSGCPGWTRPYTASRCPLDTHTGWPRKCWSNPTHLAPPPVPLRPVPAAGLAHEPRLLGRNLPQVAAIQRPATCSAGSVPRGSAPGVAVQAAWQKDGKRSGEAPARPGALEGKVAVLRLSPGRVVEVQVPGAGWCVSKVRSRGTCRRCHMCVTFVDLPVLAEVRNGPR